MKKKFEPYFKDKFILYTSILSGLLAVICLWKGFSTEFSVFGWLVITMNFIYIPLALLGGKKYFPIFYFTYSAILIFGTVSDSSMFYNNYSALFFVTVIVMLNPKLRWVAMIFYFVLITAAMGYHKEALYNYFIHIVRSLWFIGIIEYVLNDKFRRKKLILYEDEREIIRQLSTGMVYQKEVSGFSENTIYRKLKAARERNGSITREELVKRFLQETEENSHSS